MPNSIGRWHSLSSSAVSSLKMLRSATSLGIKKKKNKEGKIKISEFACQIHWKLLKVDVPLAFKFYFTTANAKKKKNFCSKPDFRNLYPGKTRYDRVVTRSRACRWQHSRLHTFRLTYNFANRRSSRGCRRVRQSDNRFRVVSVKEFGISVFKRHESLL